MGEICSQVKKTFFSWEGPAYTLEVLVSPDFVLFLSEETSGFLPNEVSAS